MFPILDSGCKATLDIYKYLLLEHEKELSSQFHLLNFIPEHPHLQSINEVVRRVNKHTEETPFSELLESMVKTLAIESTEVKTQTLQKLKQVKNT